MCVYGRKGRGGFSRVVLSYMGGGAFFVYAFPEVMH